jgi:NADH dehydrogenase
MAEEKRRPQVIIVGGGFGGLEVAKGLRDAPVDVLLVDRHNYYLFQALLYQVATAVLSEDDIAIPIRHVLRGQRNATVALAELIGADLAEKLVQVRRGTKRYDYLIIATGVEPAYFGHDEFKSHAPGLKNLDDAIEIRRRILVAFEEAEFEADEASRQGKLTFVIVGGGPTGVELAGAVIETAKRTLPREFRHIDTRTARVILVEHGEHLLKEMPDELGKRALRDLEAMGVEVRLGSYVTAVDAEGVMVGDERVPAENVFWAAGVQGVPFVRTLGVELDRAGRVVVGPDLAIPGHPEVFVVGDAAHAIDAETGQPVPGVAQGAIQMGRFVAEAIKHKIGGAAPLERPGFSYYDKGSMATIGRGRGLASIKGHTLSGFLGWLAWGFVHALVLPGFRNKVSVMRAWVRNFLLAERGSRLILGDPDLHVKRVRDVRMYDTVAGGDALDASGALHMPQGE